MFEATTIGFLVGSVFLNRGHFDLIYHWIAMVTALGAIVAAELRTSAAQSSAQHGQAGSASASAESAPGRPAIEIGWRKRGSGRRMWVPASQTAGGGSPMSTSWRRPGWWR
jgi:hypothetical protein